MDGNIGIDIDLDFGLADIEFDSMFGGAFEENDDTQICLPKLPPLQIVTYAHAKELANKLTFSKDMNAYCLLSGAFIFGDLFEALAEAQKLTYGTFYVSTLGMSANNVDSLINLVKLHGVPSVNLMVSHYFFGAERHRMIRYLLEETQGLPVKVAVARSHCKIACFETSTGEHITIQGSANLSSNRNIEQIQITENKELYEFNKTFFDKIFAHQTIIDGMTNKGDYKSAKRINEKKTWELILNG